MTELRDQNPPTSSLARLAMADVAQAAGLRSVQFVAWRDLDDPEAGGSEVHCSTIAKTWAESGIEVNIRTSAVPGKIQKLQRDGCGVNRRSGRYSLFPSIVFEGLMGGLADHDALVEVWNGMPFFSPFWSKKPSIIFLHHVHAEMWKMVLSRRRAQLGWFIESKLAPKIYKNSRIVTLSDSSKQEITDLLGLAPDNISVIPPGIDAKFYPLGKKSDHPLILAVGRLVKVKRFDKLIDIVANLKTRYPSLEFLIVGEGSERENLESQIKSKGAQDWIKLLGHISNPQLIKAYRSAWVLASYSQREGWGMTITEAAACGTPSVVSQITGHVNAIDEGLSGFMASDEMEFEAHLDSILCDDDLRVKLAKGALNHSASFSWQATARGALEELAIEMISSRRRR